MEASFKQKFGQFLDSNMAALGTNNFCAILVSFFLVDWLLL